jgi:tungstate transport system substrate-binding protein
MRVLPSVLGRGLVCVVPWIVGPAVQSRDVILASTTSTRDTGLLDSLVPFFETRTGYHVKVIAVGTGQALTLGKRGDADVVLVHAPEASSIPATSRDVGS